MNFTDIFIREPVLAIVDQPADPRAGRCARCSACRSTSTRRPQNAVVTDHAPPTTAPTRRPSPASSRSRSKARSRRRRASTTCPRPSITGVSTITATLRLNYDANRALTEINTQVNSVQQPAAAAGAAAGADRADRARPSTRCTWASTATRCRPTTSPTTWSRVVKPKLDSIEGVQTAELLGARQFALRAWLDPTSWRRTA